MVIELRLVFFIPFFLSKLSNETSSSNMPSSNIPSSISTIFLAVVILPLRCFDLFQYKSNLLFIAVNLHIYTVSLCSACSVPVIPIPLTGVVPVDPTLTPVVTTSSDVTTTAVEPDSEKEVIIFIFCLFVFISVFILNSVFSLCLFVFISFFHLKQHLLKFCRRLQCLLFLPLLQLGSLLQQKTELKLQKLL